MIDAAAHIEAHDQFLIKWKICAICAHKVDIEHRGVTTSGLIVAFACVALARGIEALRPRIGVAGPLRARLRLAPGQIGAQLLRQPFFPIALVRNLGHA
ncbi:hypothetical protein [Oricola sp.]|uniref:hypothetical protein n=1 Tax=Oricola sp. TaxID=1979950 RepID=UPI00320480A1